MTKIYFVTGILICGLLFYANLIGWTVIDPFGVARTKPTGAARLYHK